MHFDTRLVHFDAAPGDPLRPTVTPIYQTATFKQSSATEFGQYDYSRSGNPTRAVLEAQLAALEGGACGFAFSSGMAALTTVCSLVEAGGHIVAGSDLYGGTHRLLRKVVARAGVSVSFVDLRDLDAFDAALRPETRLVLAESPTNPLLQVADLEALAERCTLHGALLAVDNSLLSPVLQRPLELGADIVIHSATKFLGGHADLTAGAVITKDQALGEEIGFHQNACGNALAPFDCFLLLRGMRTLGVRVERQQKSAGELVEWLAAHPAVTAVHYPGMGGVFSFETGDRALSEQVVEATRIFATCVSFGSVGSVVSLPCNMSHASIPAEERRLPEDLVRVSVGLEAPTDLIADLAQALSTKTLRLSLSA